MDELLSRLGKVVAIIASNQNAVGINGCVAANNQADRIEKLHQSIRLEIEAMPAEQFLIEYLLAWGISKLAEEPDGLPPLRHLFQAYERDRIRRGITQNQVEAFDAEQSI